MQQHGKCEEKGLKGPSQSKREDFDWTFKGSYSSFSNLVHQETAPHEDAKKKMLVLLQKMKHKPFFKSLIVSVKVKICDVRSRQRQTASAHPADLAERGNSRATTTKKGFLVMQIPPERSHRRQR